jgi:hypothetical protein
MIRDFAAGDAEHRTHQESSLENRDSRMDWRARQDSNLRPTDSKSGALSN